MEIHTCEILLPNRHLSADLSCCRTWLEFPTVSYQMLESTSAHCKPTSVQFTVEIITITYHL